MAFSDLLTVTFVDDEVTAVAELDTAAAPRTIDRLARALPIEGAAFHGIYSGSEVACLIPPEIRVPAENATSRVLPGELAYYAFAGGVFHGFPSDVAELCWFYDRDATPSMPDGPVAVNLIGRFVDGWEPFAAVCRAMRSEGSKRVRFDRP